MAHKMQIPAAIIEEKQELVQKYEDMDVKELCDQGIAAGNKLKRALISEKEKNVLENKEFKDISFYSISEKFKAFGNYILISDKLLEIVSEKQAEEMKVALVEAERQYYYLVEWYVNLSIEEKLKLMDTDKDSVKVDNLQKIIDDINGIEYFPQKEKDTIINDITSLIDDITQKYENLFSTNIFKLIINVIITWLIYAGFYWIVNEYLWHWLTYIVILSYPFGVMTSFKQLNSVRNRKGDSLSFRQILGALSITDF